MADGFGSISPGKAEMAERLRLLYNRLFVPQFDQNQGTLQQQNGQPVVAPNVKLYPTQKGSDMPRVTPQELRKRQYMKEYGVGGGPA